MVDLDMVLRSPHIELQGHDPYDGLACPIFRLGARGGNRLFNMAWIQLIKRLPVNLRPLLGIPRLANPKGLALLLLSHETRLDAGNEGLEAEQVEEIESLLFSLKDERYRAWGYGFPWQNRSFFFPKGLSNTVVSAFVGLALLRRAQRTGHDRYFEHARDILDFFLNHLNRSELQDGICLSYSALDRSAIINTSLLAARFMSEYARLVGVTKDISELVPRLIRYAVLTQREDGSWPYGCAFNQQWVDSFHTGYNLCALNTVLDLFPDPEAVIALNSGCAYYERHFFSADGQAFYYPDTPWPVDIHSIAQAIITFCELRGRFEGADETRKKLASWTMRHMWSEQKEAYAFQRHRFWTNRLDYNRWAQAWMHYACAVEMAHAH